VKIAVSTSGAALDSPVDPRFGRSAGFLVVDTDTEQTEYVANAQNLRAAQGAGIQAAQNVISAGAEGVITGHCGPKAFRVLSGAGIVVYVGADGTVAQVLDRLHNGKLKPCEGADVEGHWV
jgi:predicted Fe-Mo cluster-binding NifX family protein